MTSVSLINLGLKLDFQSFFHVFLIIVHFNLIVIENGALQPNYRLWSAVFNKREI
jgi:hypothetical protein